MEDYERVGTGTFRNLLTGCIHVCPLKVDSAEDIGLLFIDNVNQNLLQWTMKEKNFVMSL